ncbi:MAG: hypothetical protein GY839_00755 [candidate division Zixibacteria bacterium]|nr:hypothetical protein [candidate division Zixibacteria bacterium]
MRIARLLLILSTLIIFQSSAFPKIYTDRFEIGVSAGKTFGGRPSSLSVIYKSGYSIGTDIQLPTFFSSKNIEFRLGFNLSIFPIKKHAAIPIDSFDDDVSFRISGNSSKIFSASFNVYIAPWIVTYKERVFFFAGYGFLHRSAFDVKIDNPSIPAQKTKYSAAGSISIGVAYEREIKENLKIQLSLGITSADTSPSTTVIYPILLTFMYDI